MTKANLFKICHVRKTTLFKTCHVTNIFFFKPVELIQKQFIESLSREKIQIYLKHVTWQKVIDYTFVTSRLCVGCAGLMSIYIFFSYMIKKKHFSIYKKEWNKQMHFCQWLAAGREFSPCTPVSPINKTDRHDIWNIVESGI